VLLDEPTNDLDVATLGAVEEMLIDFGGDGDRGDPRPVVPRPGGDGAAGVRGGRDGGPPRGQLQHVPRADGAEEGAGVGAGGRDGGAGEGGGAQRGEAANKAKKKGLSYAQQRELETIVGRIEAAEAEVETLSARLADPAIYAEGKGAVATVSEALGKARAQAQALTARWEALEALRDG
jgi:ATP-binding cassette subfamily F protein uup